MKPNQWMLRALGGLFCLPLILMGCGGGSDQAEDGQSVAVKATLVYYAMPG